MALTHLDLLDKSAKDVFDEILKVLNENTQYFAQKSRQDLFNDLRNNYILSEDQQQELNNFANGADSLLSAFRETVSKTHDPALQKEELIKIYDQMNQQLDSIEMTINAIKTREYDMYTDLEPELKDKLQDAITNLREHYLTEDFSKEVLSKANNDLAHNFLESQLQAMESLEFSLQISLETNNSSSAQEFLAEYDAAVAKMEASQKNAAICSGQRLTWDELLQSETDSIRKLAQEGQQKDEEMTSRSIQALNDYGDHIQHFGKTSYGLAKILDLDEVEAVKQEMDNLNAEAATVRQSHVETFNALKDYMMESDRAKGLSDVHLLDAALVSMTRLKNNFFEKADNTRNKIVAFKDKCVQAIKSIPYNAERAVDKLTFGLAGDTRMLDLNIEKARLEKHQKAINVIQDKLAVGEHLTVGEFLRYAFQGTQADQKRRDDRMKRLEASQQRIQSYQQKNWKDGQSPLAKADQAIINKGKDIGKGAKDTVVEAGKTVGSATVKAGKTVGKVAATAAAVTVGAPIAAAQAVKSAGADIHKAFLEKNIEIADSVMEQIANKRKQWSDAIQPEEVTEEVPTWTVEEEAPKVDETKGDPEVEESKDDGPVQE